MKNDSKEIYIVKGENYNIPEDAIVKVTEYKEQGILEIKNCSNMKYNPTSNNHKNTLVNYRRISNTEFINKKTGQICEYKISDNRNYESLRKSMLHLRNLIKNNYNGGKNELFVTLTTEDIITDVREFKILFKKFWRKLKKTYKTLEYVGVLEIQERGALHIHLLLKDTKNKYLFIDNDEIFRIWKKGLTKTSHISTESQNNDIDEENRIHYRNLEETFGIEAVTDYMCKYKSKEALPMCCNVYFKSSGLKSAKVYIKTYSEIRNTLNNYIFKSEETLLVRDKETGNILNKVKTEVWKIINIRKSKNSVNNKCKELYHFLKNAVVKMFNKTLKYVGININMFFTKSYKHKGINKKKRNL